MEYTRLPELFLTTSPGTSYLFLAVKQYPYLYGGNNKVHMYKDTTIVGNLDVGKVLKLQRNPAVSDTPPVIINNSNSNGWFLGNLESTLNKIGCLIEYQTSASSTSWWAGVWGASSNEVNIWYNYKGLSTKSNGSAVLDGSLTQVRCLFKM